MTFKKKYHDNIIAMDKDRQVISVSIFRDDIHKKMSGKGEDRYVIEIWIS